MDRGAEPVQAREWCARLLQMYRQWAAQRRMQVDEICEGDAWLMVVCGFGAARILGEEAGLHVLEREGGDESSRCVARVRAAPTAPARAPGCDRSPREIVAVLERSPRTNAVVRRYRLGASPLVRDARKGWRTGKAELVLAGNFDVIDQSFADQSGGEEARNSSVAKWPPRGSRETQ